jgi:hypothetical protein
MVVAMMRIMKQTSNYFNLRLTKKHDDTMVKEYQKFKREKKPLESRRTDEMKTIMHQNKMLQDEANTMQHKMNIRRDQQENGTRPIVMVVDEVAIKAIQQMQ